MCACIRGQQTGRRTNDRHTSTLCILELSPRCLPSLRELEPHIGSLGQRESHGWPAWAADSGDSARQGGGAGIPEYSYPLPSVLLGVLAPQGTWWDESASAGAAAVIS